MSKSILSLALMAAWLCSHTLAASPFDNIQSSINQGSHNPNLGFFNPSSSNPFIGVSLPANFPQLTSFGVSLPSSLGLVPNFAQVQNFPQISSSTGGITFIPHPSGNTKSRNPLSGNLGSIVKTSQRQSPPGFGVTNFGSLPEFPPGFFDGFTRFQDGPAGFLPTQFNGFPNFPTTPNFHTSFPNFF